MGWVLYRVCHAKTRGRVSRSNLVFCRQNESKVSNVRYSVRSWGNFIRYLQTFRNTQERVPYCAFYGLGVRDFALNMEYGMKMAHVDWLREKTEWL